MPRLSKPGQQQHKASRPRPSIDLATLQNAPEWMVLSDKQTSDLIGLSEDSMRRLDAIQKGIPRTELSEHRHGRTVGNIKLWLKQRTPNGGPDAA